MSLCSDLRRFRCRGNCPAECGPCIRVLCWITQDALFGPRLPFSTQLLAQLQEGEVPAERVAGPSQLRAENEALESRLDQVMGGSSLVSIQLRRR